MGFVSGSLGPAEFIEEFACLAGDDVRARDDLHVRELLIGVGMCVCDTAGTDDTDSQFILHILYSFAVRWKPERGFLCDIIPQIPAECYGFGEISLSGFSVGTGAFRFLCFWLYWAGYGWLWIVFSGFTRGALL